MGVGYMPEYEFCFEDAETGRAYFENPVAIEGKA
jgi:hypothetical protein